MPAQYFNILQISRDPTFPRLLPSYLYQENQRTSDWQNLLIELRREHKAKGRLMEVLDGLSGKKIID